MKNKPVLEGELLLDRIAQVAQAQAFESRVPDIPKAVRKVSEKAVIKDLTDRYLSEITKIATLQVKTAIEQGVLAAAWSRTGKEYVVEYCCT